MINSEKIDEVVKRIVAKFNPDKIILFGSNVTGNINNDSDLDLLIIQDSDIPVHQRGFDIRMSLLGTKIPLDILIYTNSEFREEMKKNMSFINSILKNSKLLYERTN
jgi:predicted nucleotidyltransferase